MKKQYILVGIMIFLRSANAEAGISFVNFCQAGNGNGASISCTKPTTAKRDDVVICIVYHENQEAVTSNVDYFSLGKITQPQPSPDFDLEMFWHREQGRIENSTFSWPTSTWRSISCGWYRGVTNIGAPFDLYRSSATAPNTVTGDAVSGTITTTQSSMTLVMGAGDWDGGTWGNVSGGTWGPVERSDFPDAGLFDAFASSPTIWGIRANSSGGTTAKAGIITALVPLENQRRRIRR